jgi:hypothetical protein
MQERHERALRAAADEYRRARETLKTARAALVSAIRAAYSDHERQSEILLVIEYVWKREYLRKVLGLTRRSSGDDT